MLFVSTLPTLGNLPGNVVKTHAGLLFEERRMFNKHPRSQTGKHENLMELH